MLPRLLGSHDTCPGKLPCHPQPSCGSHARAKITLQIKNPSGMVTQACKPITLETKCRKYRFEASLCYKERPSGKEIEERGKATLKQKTLVQRNKVFRMAFPVFFYWSLQIVCILVWGMSRSILGSSQGMTRYWHLVSQGEKCSLPSRRQNSSWIINCPTQSFFGKLRPR